MNIRVQVIELLLTSSAREKKRTVKIEKTTNLPGIYSMT